MATGPANALLDDQSFATALLKCLFRLLSVQARGGTWSCRSWGRGGGSSAAVSCETAPRMCLYSCYMQDNRSKFP